MIPTTVPPISSLTNCPSCSPPFSTTKNNSPDCKLLFILDYSKTVSPCFSWNLYSAFSRKKLPMFFHYDSYCSALLYSFYRPAFISTVSDTANTKQMFGKQGTENPVKGKGVGRKKPFTLTRINLELVKGDSEVGALAPVLTKGERAFYWSPDVFQQLHLIPFSLYDNHVKMPLVSPFYPAGKWVNLPRITQLLRLLSGKGSLHTKHTQNTPIQRCFDYCFSFPIWRFGLLPQWSYWHNLIMTTSNQGDDSICGPLHLGPLSLKLHQKRCCRSEYQYQQVSNSSMSPD